MQSTLEILASIICNCQRLIDTDSEDEAGHGLHEMFIAYNEYLQQANRAKALFLEKIQNLSKEEIEF